MNPLNAPYGLSVQEIWKGVVCLLVVRRKKHRGRKPSDKPLSIDQIEHRFEKRLKEKKLLAEAFLLGKNKFSNPDTVPMEAVR